MLINVTSKPSQKILKSLKPWFLYIIVCPYRTQTFKKRIDKMTKNEQKMFTSSRYNCNNSMAELVPIQAGHMARDCCVV